MKLIPIQLDRAVTVAMTVSLNFHGMLHYLLSNLVPPVSQGPFGYDSDSTLVTQFHGSLSAYDDQCNGCSFVSLVLSESRFQPLDIPSDFSYLGPSERGDTVTFQHSPRSSG